MAATTDNTFYDNDGRFSAEKFIRYLDTEGGKVPYNKDIPEMGRLPPYYDEVKFERAQRTFEKYKYCFLLVMLNGLVALLSNAAALKIIMLTNRSNTPATAFVRYRSTLRHVIIWYTSDFRPGSRLWRSIKIIKAMHNSANLEASKVYDMPTITQRELAATAFGFVGFAITTPERFGLQELTSGELEALVHFWRVICYLLGVDDRFNLCRESLAETKAVFSEVINFYLKPYMVLKHPDSVHMQITALRGIQKFGLLLRPKVILCDLDDIILTKQVKYSYLYYEVNIFDILYRAAVKLIRRLIRYKLIRMIVNGVVTRKINKLLN